MRAPQFGKSILLKLIALMLHEHLHSRSRDGGRKQTWHEQARHEFFVTKAVNEWCTSGMLRCKLATFRLENARWLIAKLALIGNSILLKCVGLMLCRNQSFYARAKRLAAQANIQWHEAFFGHMLLIGGVFPECFTVS